MPYENFMVDDVGNDIYCQMTAQLEPLGPFSPLAQTDHGSHAATISPPPTGRGIIIGVHEALLRSGQVLINYGETEDGYAALRQKNKSLVGEVQ